MNKREKERWPTVQFWRDPARPDLGLRFGLDFEQPTEDFPEIETYVPEQQGRQASRLSVPRTAIDGFPC